jgi:ABC-type branched-subunit amino acid transport system ATPase component
VVRTFQVPRLVEELSVVQNVMLGREAIERPVLRRSARREATEMVEARALLADTDLDQLMHRPAGSLGTGERKYVELARATFSSASVLLLDEPAVGLSLQEVEQLLLRLSQLREKGAAILVIDHNMHFIEGLANYVYVMEQGKVVREGAPGALKEARQLVPTQTEATTP